MALDKQKILSDLGNVVNQLQSADCGCMGKLFGQGQGQGMSPGCGGCCHRSHGHPCCGEPYTGGQGMPAQGRPCMGYCNPAQAYADGYNFMNQNVMQPVIKEVYDDLKGLNSGNAVSNNPLGAQMGLTPGVPTIPCEGNLNQSAQMGNMNANLGYQNIRQGHPMMQHQFQGQQMLGNQQMLGGQHMHGGQQMPGDQQMIDGQQMSGGHQMPGGQQMTGSHNMAGDSSSLGKFTKMFPGITQGQGGGLTFNPMEIALQMNPALAKRPGMQAMQNPMSGSGAMQQPSEANAMQSGMNDANFAPNQTMHSYQAQPDSSYQGMANQQNYTNNPATSVQPHNQMAFAANTRNHLPPNFPPQGNVNPNVAGTANQNARMERQTPNYGQHTAGVTKFKEMFPGVMQGLGDVNFDPMEIAIQMNPANKQMAAINTMQKLMSSKPLEPNSAAMKPVMNGMNAVNANFAPNQVEPESQTQQVSSEPATNQIPPDQQQQQQPQQQQQYATNYIPSNQQAAYATNVPPSNKQQEYATHPTTTNQPHQMQETQQVYTAVTDAQGNRQMPQQATEQNYQEAKQEMPMSQGYPNQVPGGRVYREPIYPVDNTMYNTIGQPIELLETKDYRSAAPNLPPYRVPSKTRNNMQYNVKSTVSKTSLLARQAGKTPSRVQMQQVYNQYKGSQSYTNQNIKDPVHRQTASDGRLNTGAVEQRQMPVERVGGDTIANNQAYYEPVKGGHVVGQVGDVVSNKPPGGPEEQLMPVKSANLRNGLQDMVYTSYPQSAAWSFHGRTDNSRPSTRYRVRV